jgi:hypothetical protein
MLICGVQTGGKSLEEIDLLFVKERPREQDWIAENGFMGTKRCTSLRENVSTIDGLAKDA